ncbi:MAG: hypothetical protein HY361_01890 [Candidatus Aenigmarchaeota archaeon]|nr:hypothetical protein [Candidatus Aenigmarchaeota archaeon]
MERENILEKFSDFFNEFYKDELMEIFSENKKYLKVDFSLLDKFDVDLTDYLLENPEETIGIAEDALKQIDTGVVDAKIRVRFYNLPESKEIRIRNVRSEHIGKMIVVDGMVKRASEVRPEVSEAIFQCLECDSKLTIIQTERMLKAPLECENPACGNRKAFKLAGQKLYDARWLAVEEPFEITEGERPSDLRIYLKEDLTSPKMQNKTEPGNRIKIVGILKELPKRVKGTPSRQMEIYLEANHVESVEIEWEELDITAENEQKILELANDPEIYSKLMNSIAPAIYGLEEIKEAIALQLFGGETHIQKDRSRVRGTIHVLLVGDPSCLIADERVVMSDGTILKIGKMGSRHLENINYKVHMGMGRNAGKTNRFHIYRKQPILEIITETGKSIRGTYNQPVLVQKDTKQKWKRLDEIKLGDKVRVLSKIDCRKKRLVKTNWIDYPYYHKSWHIKVPEFVDDELASLFGYIIADGWITKTRVGFVVNKDEQDIVPKINKIFKNYFDAPVGVYMHKRASPKVTYYGVNRGHIAKLLSFLNEKRVPDFIFQSRDSVVASFLRWLYEGDGTVFSKGRGRLSVSLKSTSIELLRDVQMSLLRFGIHSRILWEGTLRSAVIKGRKIVSKPAGSLMIRRSESIIKFGSHIGFVSEKKNQKLKVAVKYAKSHVHRIHKELTEKVVKINRLQSQDVFDIEVPKYHRFVANGIVVHNTAKSVLMKVVSGLIPRGRYVSGKGVTGAGLTATVVKDEEFLGGWVLEAGALVMTNRSLCAIDEFEKIERTDQVALHEMMEQQTISIAKANIIATLPAMTTILAGGNPKLGRFDPYLPIKEQIDIPETILSRFDLKFALRDIPNPDTDAKVTEHILLSRHFGGVESEPVINNDLYKKYVAYARKNCHPKLSREAADEIKQFYLSLRERSGEDSPIAITPRQYEALIRMAEASAKIQLRNEVIKEDALRAITLMKASLRQFGFEHETGMIDIDRAEGARATAAQRSKIRIVLDVLDELTAVYGKEIPIDEIVKKVKEQGVENPEDILRKMQQEGIIYSPKVDFYSKVK